MAQGSVTIPEGFVSFDPNALQISPFAVINQPTAQEERTAIDAERNQVSDFAALNQPTAEERQQAFQQKKIQGAIVAFSDARKFMTKQERSGLAFGPTFGGKATPETLRFARQAESSAFNAAVDLGLEPATVTYLADLHDKIKNPFPVGRTIGGIAGAIAGAATFGPDPSDIITVPAVAAGTAKFLGATAGAGLGGAGGEAGQIAIEEKRLLQKREAITAGLTEAAFEAGGRIAAGGAKLLFSPLVKKTVPLSSDTMERFANLGGRLPPSAMDDRVIPNILEGAGRSGFGGKTGFKVLDQKNVTAALATADLLLDDIAGVVHRVGAEDAGKILREAISKNPDPLALSFMDEIIDDLFTPLYGEIDAIGKVGDVGVIVPKTRVTGGVIPGTTISAGARREAVGLGVATERPLRAAIDPKGAREFAKKTLARDKAAAEQFLSPEGRRIFTKASNLPEMELKAYRDFRSGVLKKTRQLGRDLDPSEGSLKKLVSVMHNDFTSDKLIRGMNESQRRLLQNTNKLYSAVQKGKQEVLTEKLASQLKTKPASVTKQIFPDRNFDAIKDMKSALTRPVAGRVNKEGQKIWGQLTDAWLTDAVDASVGKGGKLDPAILRNKIRKLGPKSFDVMFDSGQRKNIEEIATLLETVNKRPGKHGLIVAGAQLTGVGLLYNGIAEGDFIQTTAGGLLVFGPATIAKLASNKVGNQLLRIGFKNNPATKVPVPIVARMINLLNDINQKRISKEKFIQKTKQPTLGELRGFGGRGF